MYSNNYKNEIENDIENENTKNKNDEFYTLSTKNISKNLAELLQIPAIHYDHDENLHEWKQPDEYGLSNSKRIIPSYYIQNTKNILEIDYYEIIKDDIRNFRRLNKYQLAYVKTLDHMYKDEIIHILHNCLNSIIDLLDK